MPDLKSPRVLLAIAWSVFQLYTAYAGLYDLLIQLPVHVAFATALGFLTEPTPDSPEAAEALRRRRPRRRLDGALAGLALLCAAHYVWHNGRLASRMAMVEAPLLTDVAVGMLFTALLLWASWRHIGPSLVVLALAFVVYSFVGPWLPGFLAHGGESFLTLVDQQTLTTQGIFGIPALVSATFIFLFVVFGSVMSHGGLLRCFTDGALAVAGGTRGGAGKVAVISSGLFGMVNGSAIANAVTTGAFTIPLMKRAGYRPEFAAGVEACASMGGQLIPPVMGAAAFIMAETLQVPYSTIAVAAAIPGVLYFIVVGVVATTGLGLKLATGIVGLAGGSLLGTLLLTMVAALVLGNGLPTSATYIITSIMAAPALEQLGIPKLVAHMFVFYFGILADLTPPTAISTYATSSIAGADVWKTQWVAMMLALSGFVIPFSFAYDPALLLLGSSVVHIVLRTAAATLGIVMLGAGLIGWFRAPTRSYERALLLVGAALLILPGFWSDVAGLVCFAVVWLAQRASQRAPAPAPAASVVSPRD